MVDPAPDAATPAGTAPPAATAPPAVDMDTGISVSSPAVTAPPVAERISSFLLYIHRQAAGDAVSSFPDMAGGSAEADPHRGTRAGGSSASHFFSVMPPPAADADMAAGVATDVTVDGPDVTTGGEPSDGTLVINSDTAASPTLKTTDGPEPPQLPLPTEQTTLNNGDNIRNEHSATVARDSRKRKYSPAKLARRQARIAQQDADSLANGGLNPGVP